MYVKYKTVNPSNEVAEIININACVYELIIKIVYALFRKTSENWMKFMLKANCVYFSKNEIHELDIEYGINSISNSNIELATYYLGKDEDVIPIMQTIGFDKSINIFFLSYGCYDLLKKTSILFKQKNQQSINIVCMGLATKLYEKLLLNNTSIDIAVLGECDSVLNGLCNSIIKEEDYHKVPGIAYLKNGKLSINMKKEFLDESIDFNAPKRIIEEKKNRFFHVFGTRECEGYCTFCDRNSLFLNRDENIKYRPIIDIVKEIDELVKQYDCKFITFSDPTFGGRELKEKLIDLYEILNSKNYWVQFTMNLRAELIDEEVIDVLCLLKSVGLGKVFIGIESFNETELKLYRKTASLIDNYNCLRLFNNNHDKLIENYWLEVEYGFINFNPYSSIQSLKNNLQNIKKWEINNTPYMATSKLTINSLTSITGKVKKDGLIKNFETNNLSYLFEHSFDYSFKNNEIEQIYRALNVVREQLSIKNTNGLEFIRNRYYHFFGNDTLLIEYEKTYKKLKRIINEITNDFCEFVYDNYNGLDFDVLLLKKTKICRKIYEETEQKMRNLSYKILVRLAKIDEVIYYRSIY